MQTDNELEKSYRTNKIIGAAMAGSVFIYAIIVEVLKFQQITFTVVSEPILDNLRFVFVFLSFAAYFIITFIRKRLLFKYPTDNQETLLRKLTLTNIVTLALCELPALFGLCLFLVSGNPRDFYLLLLISALLFYVFFPRYTFWAAWSQVIDPKALL
jgi:F0F1-type ATP synthase membrane subunit c/vacuolar-type H+-ATPase subunit K